VFKSKREEKFDEAMERAGMKIHEVDGDGNCLFRAVSFQAYGSESKHFMVRKKCMQYIGLEKEYFANFIPGGLDYIDEYIKKKSKDGSWGDDIEIQAMSEIYDRSVEIYAYDNTPMRTFHETKKNKNSPFRLSYHGKNHYNAVVSTAWGKDYRLISS
jgi:OTU domain-containing protein 5